MVTSPLIMQVILGQRNQEYFGEHQKYRRGSDNRYDQGNIQFLFPKSCHIGKENQKGCQVKINMAQQKKEAEGVNHRQAPAMDGSGSHKITEGFPAGNDLVTLLVNGSYKKRQAHHKQGNPQDQGYKARGGIEAAPVFFEAWNFKRFNDNQ